MKQMSRHFSVRIHFTVIVISLCLLITNITTTTASHPNRIEIYVYGPVRALVIDAEDRRSGKDFVTGEILEAIPGSAVVKEQTKERMPGWTIRIQDPAQDIYLIQLKGTGTGAFVVDVDAVDSTGHVKNNNVYRKINKDDFFEFILTFNDKFGGKSTLLETQE